MKRLCSFCLLFFFLYLYSVQAQYYTLQMDTQFPKQQHVLDHVFSGNTPFIKASFYDNGTPLDLSLWTITFRYGWSQYDTNGMVTIPGIMTDSNVCSFLGATNIFFAPYDSYYWSVSGTSPEGYTKTFGTGLMIQDYDPATATNLYEQMGQINMDWWTNNMGLLVATLFTQKLDVADYQSLTNANVQGAEAYSWGDHATNGYGLDSAIASNYSAYTALVAIVAEKLSTDTWALAESTTNYTAWTTYLANRNTDTNRIHGIETSAYPRVEFDVFSNAYSTANSTTNSTPYTGYLVARASDTNRIRTLETGDVALVTYNASILSITGRLHTAETGKVSLATYTSNRALDTNRIHIVETGKYALATALAARSADTNRIYNLETGKLNAADFLLSTNANVEGAIAFGWGNHATNGYPTTNYVRRTGDTGGTYQATGDLKALGAGRGAELVQNGTFTSNVQWNLSTLYINSGKLVCNDGLSGTASQSNSISVIPGKTYAVSYGLALSSTCSVLVSIGGITNPVSYTGTAQTVSFNASAINTNSLLVEIGTTSGQVKMDDLSVKEITDGDVVAGGNMRVGGSLIAGNEPVTPTNYVLKTGDTMSGPLNIGVITNKGPIKIYSSFPYSGILIEEGWGGYGIAPGGVRIKAGDYETGYSETKAGTIYLEPGTPLSGGVLDVTNKTLFGEIVFVRVRTPSGATVTGTTYNAGSGFWDFRNAGVSNIRITAASIPAGQTTPAWDGSGLTNTPAYSLRTPDGLVYPFTNSPTDTLIMPRINFATTTAYFGAMSTATGAVTSVNGQTGDAVVNLQDAVNQGANVTNAITTSKTSGFASTEFVPLSAISNEIQTALGTNTASGTGDFMANGSVAMTGPFDGGGYVISNILLTAGNAGTNVTIGLDGKINAASGGGGDPVSSALSILSAGSYLGTATAISFNAQFGVSLTDGVASITGIPAGTLPDSAIGTFSNKVTYSFSGADQYFVVPGNVSQLLVKVWGAAGMGQVGSGEGGIGGHSFATIAVHPLETLVIRVGGGGVFGSIVPANVITCTNMVWGGGGYHDRTNQVDTSQRTSGGGGSWVFRNLSTNIIPAILDTNVLSYAEPLVVAGGGGSGGGAGKGGGLSGGNGSSGGGFGGDQTSGGSPALSGTNKAAGVWGGAPKLFNGFSGGGGGWYGGGSGAINGAGLYSSGGGSGYIHPAALGFTYANNFIFDIDYVSGVGISGQSIPQAGSGLVVVRY